MTPGKYLAEFPTRAAALMAVEKPPTYPVPLATTIDLAADRLREKNAAAGQLLDICAFFAPEPIPQHYFATAAPELPEPLRHAAASELDLSVAIAAIGQLGLAKVGRGSLQLHRLTREVLRSRWADPAAVRRWAEAVLVAATPAKPSWEPECRTEWAVLVSHVLATPYLEGQSAAMRELVVGAFWYLYERGDLQSFRPLLAEAYDAWRDRLGVDHPDTLALEHRLAVADYQRGDYASALRLERDCYQRRSRVLGSEALEALEAGVHVASYLDALGRSEEALVLHEKLRPRLRRTLGDDARLTLGGEHNLALCLGLLQRHAEALEMHQDVFHRRERAFGPMDTHTLLSGKDLAESIGQNGDLDKAVRMHRDYYERHRSVIGRDHPNTLRSGHAYGAMLARADHLREAREVLRDTFERRVATLGGSHPETRDSARELAGVLRRLGRNAEAVDVEKPREQD